MAKRIILVHGRSYKPNKLALKRSWVAALAHGVERDFGKRALNKFRSMPKTFAYFGHHSNAFLAKHKGERWTKAKEEQSIADRKETLEALKQYRTREFTKSNYKNVRELEDVFFEAAADMFSGPLSLFGVGDNLVDIVAPDMTHYWNPDAQFGSDVRWEVTKELSRSLKRGDDIFLVAHSLGSIICYDVLWKFSHYGEYQDFRGLKINTLVTIGSPLGDENVKKQLKGAGATKHRKYPHNIGRWVNMAAEDDYISHDASLKNDYRKMLTYGLTASIKDINIYNLAVTKDGSNPHRGTGYLIHPEMSKLLKDWMYN